MSAGRNYMDLKYRQLQQSCPATQEAGFWVMVAGVLLAWLVLSLAAFAVGGLAPFLAAAGFVVFLFKFEPDKVYERLRGR